MERKADPNTLTCMLFFSQETSTSDRLKADLTFPFSMFKFRPNNSVKLTEKYGNFQKAPVFDCLLFFGLERGRIVWLIFKAGAFSHAHAWV